MSSAETFGRDDQLALLHGWIGGELPTAVLIEGDAGIGKTTLLRAVLDESARAGFHVVQSAPAEAEVSLAYGALADLAGVLVEELADVVPAPRWRALAAALGLSGDGRTAPGETSVALGLLATLRAAAERSPVLIAIDDVQWLDESSATVLAFALRRLHAGDRVAVVITRRANAPARARFDLHGSLVGEALHVAPVGPLSVGAVHRLIRVRLGLSLGRRQLLEIHEACRGNPLHALELARATRTEASGAPGLRLTAGNAMDARISRLPSAARQAILIASATPRPTVELLASLLGASAVDEAVRAAVTAEILIDRGGQLEFEHPLLASRSYESATPVARRRVHESLASVAATSGERARHLALAAEGDDEELAAVLEQEAEASLLRGTRMAAAELAEESVRLTPSSDLDARARRLLAAGRARTDAGDSDRARGLLERAASIAGPHQHEAVWRLGTLADVTVGIRETIALYERALETSDDTLRTRILQRYAITTAYLTGPRRALDLADAAVAAAERAADSQLLATALATKAAVGIMAGDPGAPDWLARARQLGQGDADPRQSWTLGALGADVSRMALDLPAARSAYEIELERSLIEGEAATELWMRLGLCITELLSGDLARTSEHVREIRDLSEQTGMKRDVIALGIGAVLAHLGHVDEARSALAESRALARADESPLVELRAAAAAGALELSCGQPEAAARALDDAHELAELLGLGFSIYRCFEIDRAEVHALAGRPQEAARATSELEALAEHSNVTWAAPLLLRGHGLAAAADGRLDEAVALLEQAVAEEHLLPLPLERARTRLALGRVLRRAKKKAAARAMLESAVLDFQTIEAHLWLLEARAELARIGGHPPARQDLTATELRVATLVAEGRTNREVAASLFITVSTVEATLTRIYRKLGVRSRTELANRLHATEPNA